jgi:hypothetical protein
VFIVTPFWLAHTLSMFRLNLSFGTVICRSQAKLMKLVDDISGDNGPMLDTDVEYLDINTTSYEDPLCETPTNNQANHRPTAAGD